MSAIQLEMKSRQDASMGPTHEVSSILQTLLKEGAFRTNIPKLSALAGKGPRGKFPLSNGAMSSKPSEKLIVILLRGKEYSAP